MGDGVDLRDRAADADWNDWRWQLRHAVGSTDAIARALSLTPREIEGSRRAESRGLPIRITPYYLGLADPNDPSCPVRRQCVPDAREDLDAPGDLFDPLGEVAHEVAPHLVQRYPDRALLLATDRCAVYCRFCTRSRMVGGGEGAVSRQALEPALAWLRSHPEVRDVIVSGGDPLAMATDRIEHVVAAVRSVRSVETIRLATRVPVTLPMRITHELLEALRPHHPIWVMTHFNHPKELSAEARVACARLADAGFPIMNQTVLLAGINDDDRVLEPLFRDLVRTRVRPYYLLQADPVRGTGHLRTPLARGIDIMERLQGRLSGIALPKFICDTPGGRGKVPLGPDYVIARLPGKTRLRTFRGEAVDYVDPPRATPNGSDAADAASAGNAPNATPNEGNTPNATPNALNAANAPSAIPIAQNAANAPSATPNAPSAIPIAQIAANVPSATPNAPSAIPIAQIAANVPSATPNAPTVTATANAANATPSAPNAPKSRLLPLTNDC
ncbi:MAG: KamA family radical SAM protein [Polyangiaceae bacterium]|jgi:lysine 2,3-aminomutase